MGILKDYLNKNNNYINRYQELESLINSELEKENIDIFDTLINISQINKDYFDNGNYFQIIKLEEKDNINAQIAKYYNISGKNTTNGIYSIKQIENWNEIMEVALDCGNIPEIKIPSIIEKLHNQNLKVYNYGDVTSCDMEMYVLNYNDRWYILEIGFF